MLGKGVQLCRLRSSSVLLLAKTVALLPQGFQLSCPHPNTELPGAGFALQLPPSGLCFCYHEVHLHPLLPARHRCLHCRHLRRAGASLTPVLLCVFFQKQTELKAPAPEDPLLPLRRSFLVFKTMGWPDTNLRSRTR